MSIKVKIGGTWRNMTDGYVKIDGVWRKIINTYFKNNNAWKENYESVITLDYYELAIDTTEWSAASSATYINDTTKMGYATVLGGSFHAGTWGNVAPFNQIKPCLFKNGSVNYYLNPNDYSKKVDGTNADITSGNDGDVMIEIPKFYWKLETVDDILYVRISPNKIDSSYKCLAHTKNGIEKNNVYIGAYLGSVEGGKLNSLSGKVPTTNQTLSQFRENSTLKGSGYQVMGFNQITMFQVLFVMMFKNINSQSRLAQGLTRSSDNAITGTTNDKGLCYGADSTRTQIKFLGIEDLWGNYRQLVEGLMINSNLEALIADSNFNDSGSGYTNKGILSTRAITKNPLETVQGTTDLGFLVKTTSTSSSMYYSDAISLSPNSIALFGGDKSDDKDAGIFNMLISSPTTYSSSNLTARLMYL